jgi:hypothetical protein
METQFGADPQRLSELCSKFNYEHFPVKHFIDSGKTLEEYLTTFECEENKFIENTEQYEKFKGEYKETSKETRTRHAYPTLNY